MARKSSARGARSRPATQADVEAIRRTFDERRQWLEKLEHTCSIQFARIAQIQAELDDLKRAVLKKEPRSRKKS
jgi:hypothetical protein